MKRTGVFVLVSACIALGTASCGGGGGGGGSNAPLVYALTDIGNLISFRADDPGSVLSTVAVTGLAATDTLVAIDVRPATGELFGIGIDAGNTVHTYVIVPATGVATARITTFGTISGHASMDFNAVPDRIRLIVGASNHRVNPNDGSQTIDVSLAYDAGDPAAGAAPDVVGIAYTNNFAGATSSTAYGVDATLDSLVTLGGPGGIPSPNGGTLFTVGPLGIGASSLVTDFDVRTAGGVDVAYLATVTPALTTSQFFTVDLAAGPATLVGAIGTPDPVVSIAVVP